MQHHAYIYEGSQELLETLVDAACKDFEFTREHNPDVHVEQWEKFGIEDSQKLKQEVQLKTLSGRALFVLGIASITSEAQQALLKLFEEPQAGVIFILLVPHGTLLPTLRSRMLVYAGSENTLRSVGTRSKSEEGDSRFLRLSGKARSDLITAILKDDEGVKERVRDFLNGVEAELAKKIKDPKVREGLEDISKVRSYLGDRSPSLKMLLEHLAMSLPTV